MLSLLLTESLCQYDGSKARPVKGVKSTTRGYDFHGSSYDYYATDTTGTGWEPTSDGTSVSVNTEDPTDANMETKIVTDVEIGKDMYTLTLKFKIRKK